MAEVLEYARCMRGLTPTEMRAFRELQGRIRAGDKEIRRKAKNEYSRWLDYLMVTGRVSPELRRKLEYYRMKDEHV